MLSKDKDLIFLAFQAKAPILVSLNKSYELLIICFVPCLYGDDCLRQKGYWVLLANF